MVHNYLLVKFIHILISTLALGTSAGLGIVLDFYGDDPAHGIFILRAIDRIVSVFVIPGYVLMLVTGLWLVHLAWPIRMMWILVSLVLWCIGMVLFIVYQFLLHKHIAMFELEGTTSHSFRVISILGRAIGAGVGIVVVSIIYLMVFKPIFS